MITKGIKELCAEAEQEIETMTVEQVMAAREEPNVQLVDIRDIRELWRDGTIPGATHAPRGMLEFWVDPASPYYKPVFGEGKKYVFFCAAAGRSALSVKTLQDMGMENIAQLGEGFKGWREAGGPVEKKD